MIEINKKRQHKTCTPFEKYQGKFALWLRHIPKHLVPQEDSAYVHRRNVLHTVRKNQTWCKFFDRFDTE